MDIVLGWLEGEGEKRLLEIYYAKSPDMRKSPAPSAKAPRAFPAKIAEKLAWLASATGSYFEEDAELLPNRLRFFVSSVSARLSYGLPANLIPFRGFAKAAKNRSDLIAASDNKQLGEAWAVANALEFYKRRVREMILVPFIRDLRQIHFADSIFSSTGKLDLVEYVKYLEEAVCQDDAFSLFGGRSFLKIRNGGFVVIVAFGSEAQEGDDVEESVLLTCSDTLMAPGGRVDVAVGICACGLLLRGFVTPGSLKRLALSNSLTLEALLDNASDQLKEVPFLVRGLVQYPILSA